MSYGNKRIPVPYTGRTCGFKRYYKTYYRIVKTTNEIRQFYACNSVELIRGSRKPSNLHKVFDDVTRHQEKCWKRQNKNTKQHGHNQLEIRQFLHFYDESLLEEI